MPPAYTAAMPMGILAAYLGCSTHIRAEAFIIPAARAASAPKPQKKASNQPTSSSG